jgi:hypothetical protein
MGEVLDDVIDDGGMDDVMGDGMEGKARESPWVGEVVALFAQDTKESPRSEEKPPVRWSGVEWRWGKEIGISRSHHLASLLSYGT